MSDKCPFCGADETEIQYLDVLPDYQYWACGSGGDIGAPEQVDACRISQLEQSDKVLRNEAKAWRNYFDMEVEDHGHSLCCTMEARKATNKLLGERWDQKEDK